MIDSESEEEEGPQTKRVNITIPTHLHEEFTAFARNNGMNFSEFIRTSCIHRQDKMEGGDVSREYRPLLREIKRVDKKADTISDIETRLSDIERTLDQNLSPNKSSGKEIAERILALREESQSEWTLSEWANRLDLSLEEVQRGRSQLEKSYAIIRVAEDSETGPERWIFRGQK